MLTSSCANSTSFRPSRSEIILENVQFIFDDFLKTQSVVKRLKVESVSLGEIPVRIKRIRTSLPEEHVAVTKQKAGKAASSKFAHLQSGVYSEDQHEAFAHLLAAFQASETRDEARTERQRECEPRESVGEGGREGAWSPHGT